MTAVLTQAKADRTLFLLRMAKRLAILLVAGLMIGFVCNRLETALQRRNEPAGFVHGIVQGVLMPIALPTLAMGNDVPIYAASNTGRTYKLGYTMGVNGCGLVFFGVFFWRIRRLTRRLGVVTG